MLINKLAQQAGVTPKTIRYYESIGLMPPPSRGRNNYRIYAATDVARLRFIHASRALSYSLAEIASLLAKRDANQLDPAEVITILNGQLGRVEQKIASLMQLRDNLTEIRQQVTQLPADAICSADCICVSLIDAQLINVEDAPHA